eukprot:5422376-Alexandrium_andersonii.AAC.1
MCIRDRASTTSSSQRLKCIAPVRPAERRAPASAEHQRAACARSRRQRPNSARAARHQRGQPKFASGHVQ